MSIRRKNLSLFVEHTSPSSNRTARVLQLPNPGSYEITKENHPPAHEVSVICSYLFYVRLIFFRVQ